MMYPGFLYLFHPIPYKCFFFIPPKNTRKSMLSGGYKVGTLGSNGLIMITLIYTKQIIHLSGPVDETSFFARDRLMLVLE